MALMPRTHMSVARNQRPTTAPTPEPMSGKLAPLIAATTIATAGMPMTVATIGEVSKA
jgi:fatty acid desaturase